MNAAYASTLDLFDAKPTAVFPPPRAFQDKTHEALRQGVREGHRCQLVMAPTGAGKTYLALRVCNETLRLSTERRVLFICDRKTLIDQTSKTADRYGMQTHGIIQAENPRFAPHRQFQIASAQTLAVRGFTDDYDVVVVDEAHTLHDTTTEFIKTTKAKVIGLSATPFTRGLGKLYSNLINAATMKELVDLGVLTPFRTISCVKHDFMKGAKVRGNDEWTDKAATERGLGLVGDVVSEWVQHADDRKTIVFGSSIVHCESIQQQFEQAGIRCALFTKNTSDNERKDLLEEYTKTDAKLRVLVSVEALAKGFDVPDVGVVMDCRPLRKSLSTFVQMLGRGLRSSPDKTECLLLDFSGNIIRFAQDFSDLYFNGLDSLDAGERLDREVRRDEEHTPKPCPSCGFIPLGKRCVKCGFGAKTVSLVEHDVGEGRELDVLRQAEAKKLAQQRAYGRDDAEIFAAIITHEKERSAKRVAKGDPPGNPQGASWHRFREVMGRPPIVDFTYANAPHVPPNDALRNKLMSLVIAFAKSKRGAR